MSKIKRDLLSRVLKNGGLERYDASEDTKYAIYKHDKIVFDITDVKKLFGSEFDVLKNYKELIIGKSHIEITRMWFTGKDDLFRNLYKYDLSLIFKDKNNIDNLKIFEFNIYLYINIEELKSSIEKNYITLLEALVGEMQKFEKESESHKKIYLCLKEHLDYRQQNSKNKNVGLYDFIDFYKNHAFVRDDILCSNL